MSEPGTNRPPTRTRTGRQLYDLLPEVYRTRDRNETGGRGDLAAYLDACGELLDRIRDTLDQRLADAFPDRPAHGRAAQEWILPYFAQLLDVRLVSPHVEGRRAEVARAVAWRQRKGTLATVDRIAEAVAQTDAEVHEGWKRVAVTPRPGLPLEPSQDLPRPLDPRNPLDAALHPGLPAVTPDLRRHLGIPGTHEDRTRRTVDVRMPRWDRGHYHPRRLILFTPPPVGFFPATAERFRWSERDEHEDLLQDVEVEDGGRVLINPVPRWSDGRARPEGRAVVITTRPPVFEGPVTIEELSFLDTLTFEPAPGERVVLRGVAAARVVVRADGLSTPPVLDARDCLLGEIDAGDALVRLEYCTVLERCAARRVEASDCLFAGEVEIGDRTGAGASCIRYSRIPPELARQAEASEEDGPPVTWLRRPATTTEEPAFFDLDFGEPGGVPASPELDRPGCGVLHPATPEAVCSGAEDGGEMGAYHRHHHCLQRAAVLDKLADFLPVGIEAALVPDPRLLADEPGPTTTTE
ncbi:MAG: phage tail protein [Acidobacteriota bacterium]|jgi:hypothetical protein